MKIIVSDQADNDLLQRCIESLSSFPLRGSPRSDLGRDVRSIVVPPYLILYAVRRDHAPILRVLHGSRDIKAEFLR